MEKRARLTVKCDPARGQRSIRLAGVCGLVRQNPQARVRGAVPSDAERLKIDDRIARRRYRLIVSFLVPNLRLQTKRGFSRFVGE
jgi:hypothetical protein